MSQESLAASSGALLEATAFEMPAIFQEPTEKVVGRFNSPYLAFAHQNRKEEYGKFAAKFGAVNEGDMFLVEGDEITKLDVAKVNVLKIKQYWVQKNAAGDILQSSFAEMPRPWAEHIDAVFLVHLGDRVVVANVNPHTTKCSGFKTLNDALLAAQTPEWGDKSPAHRETLQISQPWVRFYGELSVVSPRTSKTSGLPYRTTNCSIKPTTNAEVVLLKKFMADPESSKQMKDAADFFTFRIKEIESKQVKK